MIKLKRKITNFTKNMNGTKLLVPFIILLLLGFSVGATIAKHDLGKQLKNKSDELEAVKNERIGIDSLKDSLETELNEIKNSKDYLRLKVLKSSGVKIPGHVSKEDLELMINQADKYNIPHKYFFRLIKNESTTDKHPNGFDRNAFNRSSGAKGYMQITPDTYRSLSKKMGVKGINTPHNNILVGSYYISELKKYWVKKTSDDLSSWALTFASYNAGINSVIKANNKIPKYNETNNYLNYIFSE